MLSAPQLRDLLAPLAGPFAPRTRLSEQLLPQVLLLSLTALCGLQLASCHRFSVQLLLIDCSRSRLHNLWLHSDLTLVCGFQAVGWAPHIESVLSRRCCYKLPPNRDFGWSCLNDV